MIFNCKCDDKTKGIDGCINGETNQFQIAKAIICCSKNKCHNKADNDNDNENNTCTCTYSVAVTVGTAGDFETLQQMYDWSNTISSYEIKVTLVSDLTNDEGHVLFVMNGKRYILNGNGYTITQNATNVNYAIVVSTYTYLALENITIKNLSNTTSTMCLWVSTNSICRIMNEKYPITFINGNQTNSTAVFCHKNANILFEHLGTTNIQNSSTGVLSSLNSAITMSSGVAPNFTNVTTQYTPAKNTLSSDGSFIFAP